MFAGFPPHKDTLTSSWLLRSSLSKDQKNSRLLIIWGSKWRDPLDQLLSHFFFFFATLNSIKYILYAHTHKYLWLNQKSHKTILPFIVDGPWYFSSSSFCSIAGGRGQGREVMVMTRGMLVNVWQLVLCGKTNKSPGDCVLLADFHHSRLHITRRDWRPSWEETHRQLSWARMWPTHWSDDHLLGHDPQLRNHCCRVQTIKLRSSSWEGEHGQ